MLVMRRIGALESSSCSNSVISSSAKASTRGAEEGRLGIKVDGGALTLVELTATTDFSAKNDDFKKLLNQLVDLAAAGKVGTAEALLKKELGGRPVEEVVKETAGKIGENIAVKRVLRVEGNFGYYLHSDYKQGAVVELDGVTGRGHDLAHELPIRLDVVYDEHGSHGAPPRLKRRAAARCR